MLIRQYNRFLHSPPIYALDRSVLGASIDLVVFPLNGAYPLRVQSHGTADPFLEVVIKDKRALAVPQSYFGIGRTKMYCVYFLVVVFDYVLTVECILQLVVQCHVVEVQLVLVGRADEVVV